MKMKGWEEGLPNKYSVGTVHKTDFTIKVKLSF